MLGDTRKAVESTIKALKKAQKIDVDGVHASLVATCLALAEQVDDDPSNARLWKEFRAADEALRGLDATSNVDAVAELLRSLSAPVGDAAKPASRDVRRQAGKDRGDARSAVDAVAAARRRRRPGD